MSKEEIYLLMVDTLHEMLDQDKAKTTPAANLYTDPDIDSIDGWTSPSSSKI
jgi:acyl carrier protein